MDPKGRASYSITGKSQILSVPYALYSKRAESYNETDPVFCTSALSGISSANITNWNNGYGWGNYAHAGYNPSSRTLTINKLALEFELLIFF